MFLLLAIFAYKMSRNAVTKYDLVSAFMIESNQLHAVIWINNW